MTELLLQLNQTAADLAALSRARTSGGGSQGSASGSLGGVYVFAATNRIQVSLDICSMVCMNKAHSIYLSDSGEYGTFALWFVWTKRILCVCQVLVSMDVCSMVCMNKAHPMYLSDSGEYGRLLYGLYGQSASHVYVRNKQI